MKVNKNYESALRAMEQGRFCRKAQANGWINPFDKRTVEARAWDAGYRNSLDMWICLQAEVNQEKPIIHKYLLRALGVFVVSRKNRQSAIGNHQAEIKRRCGMSEVYLTNGGLYTAEELEQAKENETPDTADADWDFHQSFGGGF